MSKTSIALLIMFFVSLGVLLICNTMYSSNPVLKSIPGIFPTKAPIISANNLSLNPNQLTVTAGKASTIEVIIESQGEKPSMVQVELAYDPLVLGNIKIVPGSFFQNPEVVLSKVNERNGRISYAIGPSEGKEDATSSNVVATIQVTPRITSFKRQTTLEFLPKSIVKTKGSQNTLKNVYGTKISFSSRIIPLASPSAATTNMNFYQTPSGL